MNRHDYFRLLTKGVKFAGNDNKEILKRFGYLHEKKEKETKEDSEVFSAQLDEGRKGETVSDGDATTDEQANCLGLRINDKEKWALIQREQINHIRNVKKIHVHGTDIPPPVQTFDELSSQYKVSQKLIENLLSEGYSAPTPIQMQAWSLLIRRRELLASAPTGSGKTAAFLIPILHHLKTHRTQGVRAVILAPTRELAKQIIRENERLSLGTGLKSCIINKATRGKSINFMKKCDMLITTPNRLIFLLQDSKELTVILSKVEWLIVDESDRLYEAGRNGFRDQLATIYKACSGPNVVRAMFSATYDYHVEQWCKLNLNEPVSVSIGARNSSCPDVHQELVFCGSDQGKVIALRDIIQKGYEPPVLIFVQTKERARQLYKELLLDNLRVACIHSDNTQAQRDAVVRAFRERKIWLLICTELMGRGIDFIGINMVINYDFPPSLVSYIHRVGRTGRAGRKGVAKTFWTLEDKPLLKSVAQIIKNSGSQVDDFLLNLKKENKRERRKYAKNLPDRGFISERAKREKVQNQRIKKSTKKSETRNEDQVAKGRGEEDRSSDKRKGEAVIESSIKKLKKEVPTENKKRKKKKIV